LHGYQVRLAQIQQLAKAIWHEKNQVSAIKEDMERYSRRLDLISDALQLVVTCGGTAIRNARAAKSLTGVAAEVALAHKREAYKEIGKEVAKFSAEQGANAINENLGTATKFGTKSVGKAIEISKAAVVVKRAKDAAMLFARGADFILDWVSPSQVAKVWIGLRTGQSPDDALN
jgi:hypothetical protein